MDALVARGSVTVSPSARSPVPPSHVRPDQKDREVRPMPRVLVAHPSADRYGSDRQVLESVHGLRSAGWEVAVALPGPGPLVDLLPPLTLDVAPFPVLRKALLRPAALLRLAGRMPLELARLVRRIRAFGPDVVYVNTVTIPWWTLAARLAGVPVLVHVHEAEELSSARIRKLLYAPLLLAGTVVANSATTKRVLLESHRRLADRLAVVPNGLPDAGPVAADRPEPGRIVLVSRLSPRKGVDVALEALARLRAEGRPVTLEICGTAYDGYEWFADQLRARAAEPDLAGAVHFAGYVAPVSTALARGQVVIAPSLGESFGNAAVEAMLAARPLVAADVQGLAEIVDDGRTGLLVAPADPAALAAAIGRLLDDPGLAARLAAAGRADALERFSAGRYHRDVVARAGELERVRRDGLSAKMSAG
jgi:glycosyltransferase involved in cell wall biosynthesis